jgi:hypothetical protein
LSTPAPVTLTCNLIVERITRFHAQELIPETLRLAATSVVFRRPAGDFLIA